MRITQDVRDYAAQRGMDTTTAAVAAGMSEKSAQFLELGRSVYVER
ncbi:hypothetical protein [Nocardioides sp. SYSU DS0663]